MTIEIDRETFSVGFMAKGSVAMSTARCDFETNVFVIKKNNQIILMLKSNIKIIGIRSI